MSLTDRINEDIKAAMRAKEPNRLNALRAIKNALLVLQTSGKQVNEEAEIKELQKLLKQRKEAAEIYQTQDRNEAAEEELAQAKVIEEYLPQQMGEDEIRAEVQKVIAETGATTPADMGKVMGSITKQLAGKADNRMVSSIVREELNK